MAVLYQGTLKAAGSGYTNPFGINGSSFVSQKNSRQPVPLRHVCVTVRRTEQPMFTTLISTANLARHLSDPQWVAVDCSFSLADETDGERTYHQAHIPGALYAHLNLDLSSAPNGTNGRHPLPDVDEFKSRLSEWAIDASTQVVAYDQDLGMFATRLWWLLRYLGHDAVAVLDGGMAQWMSEGKPTRSGVEAPRASKQFVGSALGEMLVTLAEVERLRADPNYLLIDARAPERYRGEVETIDPVAGHIPGAVNHFYQTNMNSEGLFLSPQVMRARFEALRGDRATQNVINYCGSGVSACHNLLAMEHAGLRGARLYAGSWSEWCADPTRPCGTGD